MNPTVKKLLATASVAAIFGAGMAFGPGAVSAQGADETDSTATTQPALDEVTQAKIDECDAVFEEIFAEEMENFEELTDEDISEINAEEEALATHLDAAGVSYERITDEAGFSYVEIDWEDEAAVAAYDTYWESLFDDELVDDEFDFGELDAETEARLTECDSVFEEAYGDLDFDMDLSDEELAEINAETQQLIDALSAAGITVSTTDDDGFLDFDLGDLTEEQEAVVDGVFEDVFGAMMAEIPAEELAAMNAEEDAIAAYLDDKGISYERVDVAPGMSFVEIDWEDEAAIEAYDSYWSEAYGDDMAYFEDLDPDGLDVDDLDSLVDPADHETEDDGSDN